MKTGKRILACLVAMLIPMSFILAGCSKNDEPGKARLGCWDGEDSQAALKQMAEGLDSVGLELMTYPTANEFWSSLSSQTAAGTAPDFAIVTNEKIYEYISRGLVQEIKLSDEEKSGINEMALDAWTLDGKLYGYPLEIEANCLVINLNVWEAAGLTESDYPKTWADVEALSAIIDQKVEGAYGFNIFIEDPFHITNLVNSFGGGWGYGESIDSAANAEAIDWLIGMFDKGYACTPAQLGFTWDGEVMVADKAAMTIGGVWYHSTMTGAGMGDRYAVVTMPKKDANTGTSCTHSGAFVILEGTKNYDNALKLIKHMARPDAQKIRSEVVGMIPAATSVRDTYYDTHQTMLPLEGAELDTVAFAYPAETEKFTTNLINEITGVLYNEGASANGSDILKSVLATGNYAAG